MAILVFQVSRTGPLILGNLGLGPTLPGGVPARPGLEEPVRPREKIRRYAPCTRPGSEAPEDARPMPVRLVFEEVAEGVVRLRGEIAEADGAATTRAFAGHGAAPDLVLLDCPGGVVGEALTLGRHLRRLGVATGVESDAMCMSACPYLLAAGTERRVATSALVGVHQHYFRENKILAAFVVAEDIQRGQGEVMRYPVQMGVAPVVMRPALLPPPDEIYILEPTELTAHRLATGIGNPRG